MGVKDLWDVLAKVRRDVSVEELRGKTLAVDLSIWLRQGQKAARLKGKQGLKPHLRNLLSRTALLLRYQIRPVFILDGPAPKLKELTIQRRQELIAAAAQEEEVNQYPLSTAVMSRQCCELLDCLGMPYFRSTGEAEMTCAQLNLQGIVDGCITEDSDVFLFGATTVYRNFTVSAGKTNSIECYEMSSIESPALGLTRNKLIVYALLAGCDYTHGVKDVGKEKAHRLLQSWPSDEDVFQRLRDWHDQNNELERVSSYKNAKKPTHCSQCGHLGSVSAHKSTHCAVCQLSNNCYEKSAPAWHACPCDWHQKRAEYNAKSLEISVRAKACSDPAFPNEEIIQAFLHPDPGLNADLSEKSWTRPNYHNIKAFLQQQFKWDDAKVAHRVVRILTSWDMRVTIQSRTEGGDIIEKSQPERIVKSRTKEGKKIYEMKWKSIEGVDDQETILAELITEEFQDYVRKAFPELVEQFESEMAASKPKKQRLGTHKRPLTLNQMFKQRKKKTV